MIVTLDPSSKNIGVIVENKNQVYVTNITPRENYYNGNRKLKQDRFSYDVLNKKMNELLEHFKPEKNLVLILPENGGYLNPRTIKLLERINGTIIGICKAWAYHKISEIENIRIIFFSEMKARANVLKNIDGEDYKEKALKNLANKDYYLLNRDDEITDDIADAYTLFQYYKENEQDYLDDRIWSSDKKESKIGGKHGLYT